MDIRELQQAAAPWSLEDLREGIEILRGLAAIRNRQIAARFRPGDMVEFSIAHKRGRHTQWDRVRGRVVKKMRKNVKVEATERRSAVTGFWVSYRCIWTVCPGKLEEVSK